MFRIGPRAVLPGVVILAGAALLLGGGTGSHEGAESTSRFDLAPDRFGCPFDE